MNYQKTQYGIFSSILIVLICILMSYAYWFQSGSNPIPLTVYLILLPLFIIAFLIFHKLTISINHELITAKFGLGLIKKQMSLQEIDLESIEKVKLPWYYGIGIRITPKGTLYNVKVGEAILIKNKHKTKTFLVGTNDFDILKKTIINLKNQ